jgi:hypothetical protein
MKNEEIIHKLITKTNIIDKKVHKMYIGYTLKGYSYILSFIIIP